MGDIDGKRPRCRRVVSIFLAQGFKGFCDGHVSPPSLPQAKTSANYANYASVICAIAPGGISAILLKWNHQCLRSV